MSFSILKISLPTFYTVVALLLAVGNLVSGQNCGCAPNECCSEFGFCGANASYCGRGCQSGPCFPPPGNNGVRVADVVTDAFFNGIANRGDPSNCPRKGFYTRSVFLEALGSNQGFGTVGSADDSKREIAAYFAHFTHETGFMCFTEERNPSEDYCERDNTEWACVAGKSYHGRGPLQLSWNYNYGPAGRAIGFDGLNNPEIVAADPLTSFRASFWFWMRDCHEAITSGRGFGETIRLINGDLECNGRDPGTVATRVGYYRDYCSQLGVDPGTNLEC